MGKSSSHCAGASAPATRATTVHGGAPWVLFTVCHRRARRRIGGNVVQAASGLEGRAEPEPTCRRVGFGKPLCSRVASRRREMHGGGHEVASWPA
jgi:hypothetical protein